MSRFSAYCRKLTASSRALPNYLILGTQKGGTTSVYEYLNRHPQVVPSKKREVHFFDLSFHRGIKEYRRYFPLRRTIRKREQALGKPVLTGESSPYYLFHPHCPQRIREALPEAKLIVVLRNPVDRAYSHYTHNRRKGRESRSFAEAVREELDRFPAEAKRLMEDLHAESEFHRHYSYVHRGFYAEQIKRYLKHFPAVALLAIRSEDLFEQPRKTMDRICAFLRIEPMPEDTVFTAHNRQDYDSGIDPETRKELRNLYAPHNANLKTLLGAEFSWDTAPGFPADS